MNYPQLQIAIEEKRQRDKKTNSRLAKLASILEINDADDGAEFEDLELNNESPIHEATILNDS